MTTTATHLQAALDALAQVRDDDGERHGTMISVHSNPDALEFVAAQQGATRRWSYTENGEESDRYEVASATVGGVTITAFGPHQAMKMVPADEVGS